MRTDTDFDAGFDARAVFEPPDAQIVPDVPLWQGGGFEDEEFRLVERAPEVDAQGVEPDVRIELTFSSPLRTSAIPSVYLTRTSTSERVGREVTVQGQTVWIDPHEPLEPGGQYELSVTTVRAADGSNLYGHDWESSWAFTVAEAEGTIALSEPLDAIAHDAARARLWGTARESRALVLVDLAAGEEVAKKVLNYVPSDLCASPDGTRVYIVHRGTSLITEVDANTLEVLRQVSWAATDDGADDAHLHVRCTQDDLWLVDAGTNPGLWRLDLTAEPPASVLRQTSVWGVGDLALSTDGATLYLLSQNGWGAQDGSEVRAYSTSPVALQDEGPIGPVEPESVALDAPVLLDEENGRVLTRNRVLQADDLPIILFTFDSDVVLRAVDPARNRAASLKKVYSLTTYREEKPVWTGYARHVFFDQEGALRIVAHEPQPRLMRQVFDADM